MNMDLCLLIIELFPLEQGHRIRNENKNYPENSYTRLALRATAYDAHDFISV